jgi:hypothetical protein
MFAPPATPADRVKILREGYARALKDPELIAEAKKARMDMEARFRRRAPNLNHTADVNQPQSFNDRRRFWKIRKMETGCATSNVVGKEL